MFAIFAVENNSLTSCEGMAKHGPIVYVDFYKIKRPCNCTVIPSFVGELIVTSREVTISTCNTEINVQNLIVFGCPINMVSSQTINVIINQLVNVRADYKPPYTSGTFYHCLGFQQNGLNVYKSIICTISCCFVMSIFIA